ncbi:hypothetical protein DOTSEDRAFT_128526 [Dothistroma septosporum NZE10]|uniref:Uncharacterized protein n=1 Tax=Dothistroma septosporum (strain NZE10 / CBS 128990) TaxID=675120 RepID=N1PTS0_DOTSN|nr:hypothetical protein DOTSEDRAFT_128526 [Dothistroma septosporum NZE10]
MAKSMRGGPVASPAPAREARPVSPEPVRGKGRDSFSIRSLSPTGSLFGRKRRAEEVKQSIRGINADSGARMSMRHQPAQKPIRPRSTQKPKSAASKFKSRFADSDDESDDDKASRDFFKSRFATESDDEDDDVFIPADLRPVRGIPRRQGQTDGDSTDLEDEEDNSRTSSRGREKMASPMVPASADVDAAMEIARKKLGITNGPTESTPSEQGGALQQGSLRGTATASQVEPKSKLEEVDLTPRKRGWSLLRRNRNSASSVTQVTSRPSSDVPPVPPVLPSPTLAGPMIATFDTPEPQTPTPRPRSPTISLAGKLVRRSSAQQAPRFRRGDSTYSNATAPPAMGESTVFGDWPLPPVPSVPEKYNDRPFTSDGPQVRFDESSDPGVNTAAEGRGGVFSARTGKKKKFGMLRKAFGLAD